MKKIYTSFIRSNHIESIHSSKILISNLKGKILFSTGNENDYIYPRSSIKIFQAIPFIASKAVKNFKLNPKIIALSSSSHRGEKYHVKELTNWLNKLKIKKSALKCGLHYPLNLKAKEDLLRSNKKINQLHNNCSGKHLGMLASCLMNNYSINDYLNFNHPHQKNIRNVFEQFSENKIYKKNFGIDGCSAPQYAFKLKDINRLLINLIKSYKKKFDYFYETKLLIDSILENPNYIGGTDSLDSAIIKISKKKIFCKGGAEGVFLFLDLKKEICGVIKIVDGNERAIPPLLFNIFKKLKMMNTQELDHYRKIYKFHQLNHANILVGTIETNI